MKIVLFMLTILLLMSSVGAYAGTAGETGNLEVDSPSSEPLSIGWTLTDGNVAAVKVTWTPVAASVYTIQAQVGTPLGIVTGILTTPLTSTSQRTDLVAIAGVKPEDLQTVNVAIVEN